MILNLKEKVMSKGIVIIRGKPETHNKTHMEEYIQENEIEVVERKRGERD